MDSGISSPLWFQCFKRKEKKLKYFEEKEEAGFDFAYQYPGMNKVLQAAGRVIRTTEDEGIILLLDDRFLKKEYLELFPREWEHFQMVNRKNVGQCLSDFWESRGR